MLSSKNLWGHDYLGCYTYLAARKPIKGDGAHTTTVFLYRPSDYKAKRVAQQMPQFLAPLRNPI